MIHKIKVWAAYIGLFLLVAQFVACVVWAAVDPAVTGDMAAGAFLLMFMFGACILIWLDENELNYTADRSWNRQVAEWEARRGAVSGNPGQGEKAGEYEE